MLNVSNSRVRRIVLAAVAGVILPTGMRVACADATTWNDPFSSPALDNHWRTAARWTNGVPASNFDVYLDSSSTIKNIVIDNAAVCASIFSSANYSILDGNGSLTVFNDINVSASALHITLDKLVVNGNFFLNNGDLFLDVGTLNSGKTVTIVNALFSSDLPSNYTFGAISATSGSDIRLYGAGLHVSTINFTGSDFTIEGTGASHAVAPSIRVATGSAIIRHVDTATIALSGGGATSEILDSTADFVTSNGTYSYSDSNFGSMLLNGNYNLSNNAVAASTVVQGGNIQFNGGTFSGSTILGQNTGSGDIGGSGSLTTTRFLGTVTIGDAGGSYTLTNDSIISFASLKIGAAGAAGGGGTLINNAFGSISMSGSSTLTLGASSGSVGEYLQPFSSEFKSGTGTVTVNATGRIFINDGTATLNRIVQDSGIVGVGNFGLAGSSVSPLLKIENGVRINSGGLLQVINKGTLRLDSTLTFNGGILNVGGGTLQTTVANTMDVEASTVNWAGGTLEADGLTGKFDLGAGQTSSIIVPATGAIRAAGGGSITTGNRSLILGQSGVGTVSATGTEFNFLARVSVGTAELRVGEANASTVTIGGAGRVDAGTLTAGFSVGGVGTIAVDGVEQETGIPAQLNVSSLARIGVVGNGSLIISNGGAANLSALSIGTSSGIGFAKVAGSSLGISNLAVPGATIIGNGSLLVGPVGLATLGGVSLSPGSGKTARLIVDATRTTNLARLNSSGTLTLSGLGTAEFRVEANGTATFNKVLINTGTLGLGGGTLNASSLSLLTSLTGNGTINSPFNGGTASTITPTGALLINVGSGNFVQNGTILLGSNTLQITDSTAADLGTLTSISGGTLAGTGGLRLEESSDLISGYGYLVGGIVGSNATAGLVATGSAGLSAGVFPMNNQNLTVLTNLEVPINSSATLNGSTLRSTAGFRLKTGATLTANVGTVAGAFVGETGSTINASAGSLVIGDGAVAGGFATDGTLIVGSAGIKLLTASPATLGTLTAIAGGTLDTPNGFLLASGKTIRGNGLITGRASALAGSVIEAAGGSLTVGLSTSSIGFVSDGESRTGRYALTLNDLDQASLGTLTVLGDPAGIGSGTLNIPNGAQLTPGRSISGYGIVAGALENRGVVSGTPALGSITLASARGVGSYAGNVAFSGSFSPGNGPAIVTGENLTFLSTNTIAMEIGGATPGSTFDRIDASGNIAVGGTLEVDLINGFLPALGASFRIINFNSHSGDFSAVTVSGSPGLTFLRNYDATGLTLLTAPKYNGDANLDGKVDISDLYILATHYKGPGDFSTGDFNASGVVDAADLGILAMNWQAGVGAPGAASLDAAAIQFGLTDVPEPTMLGVLAVGLLVRRRRYRCGAQR